MQNLATGSRSPSHKGSFMHNALDALQSAQTDLRNQMECAPTRREMEQVMLARTHIEEAVGLLNTIAPKSNIGLKVFVQTRKARGHRRRGSSHNATRLAS